ncbi:MAG: hypothetical protein DRJ10_20115, partial [Bacteroidetes bacterium]
MKQDELNNLTQDENNKTENVENEKNETNLESISEKEEVGNVVVESEVENVVAETEVPKTENVVAEKEVDEDEKESAADLILKKLKNKTVEKVQEPEELKNSSEKDETEKPELEKSTEEKQAEDKVDGKEEVKAEEFEKVDYSRFSKDELIQNFSDLLEQPDIQKVKDRIELIKVNFYKKHHAEIELEKKKFLEADGKIEDFKPEEDKLEEKFKAFYSIYKERRSEYAAKIEDNKKSNLEKKYKIIDDIKELINGQESMNKTFNEFKDLQNQWHESGLVPQSEVKKLWDSYHHWVEKFYDYVKLNK